MHTGQQRQSTNGQREVMLKQKLSRGKSGSKVRVTLTVEPQRHKKGPPKRALKVERAKRFELSTSTLAR